MTVPPRVLLRRMFDSAVARAMPARCLPAVLQRLRTPPTLPRGRTVVVGAGKAAAAMAQAVEAHWPGELSGVVVTRYGHQLPTNRIEVLQAAHPVPDQAGEVAARRILALVDGLSADDLVLCLLSGGGSSLLTLPAPGLTLADKQQVNRALLKCGAHIGEINCVRKHLSAIKGGRLAAACHPASVVTLAISDVPGDDPAVIASGPTVADPTTCADARAVLDLYGISPPKAVVAHLSASSGAETPSGRVEAVATAETPKPGDPRLRGVQMHLVATPQASLDAAAQVARDAGLTARILGDSLEGEARDLAATQAALALDASGQGGTLTLPGVLLSGGETTVTVRGSGRGGRNLEFLLALTLALRGKLGVYALAADTDGIDGTEDAAGAFVDPDTLARAAARGLDPARHLAENDAYGFFAALGDLIVTGPTHTNVNDFRAILLQAP